MTFDVLADALSGERYAVARAQALDRWPKVMRYEQRAGRPVPMFVLRRITPR